MYNHAVMDLCFLVSEEWKYLYLQETRCGKMDVKTKCYLLMGATDT